MNETQRLEKLKLIIARHLTNKGSFTVKEYNDLLSLEVNRFNWINKPILTPLDTIEQVTAITSVDTI